MNRTPSKILLQFMGIILGALILGWQSGICQTPPAPSTTADLEQIFNQMNFEEFEKIEAEDAKNSTGPIAKLHFDLSRTYSDMKTCVDSAMKLARANRADLVHHAVVRFSTLEHQRQRLIREIETKGGTVRTKGNTFENTVARATDPQKAEVPQTDPLLSDVEKVRMIRTDEELLKWLGNPHF